MTLIFLAGCYSLVLAWVWNHDYDEADPDVGDPT